MFKYLRNGIIILLAMFILESYGGAFFNSRMASAATSEEDLQNSIDKAAKKAQETQKQIDASQNVLQKTQVEISTTQQLINKTETDISRKEAEIKSLGNRIELNKKILSEYIKELYVDGVEDPFMQIALSGQGLNELAEQSDQLLSVKDKIIKILQEIDDSKNKVEQVKSELEDKKDEHEKILTVHKSEQVEIKEDIQQAEATLAELNAKINKLKGELSSLLGSNVSFDNVMEAADFASKATGVRKDFILGMLVVESGLGKFTGGCTADKSNMSKYRLGIFKDICSELKYDWKKKKVSCPPSSYKGTGGAMGVAQFMPDTWLGYKSIVSSLTGHKPPDPWNLTDGVVAMAKKLANGGASSKTKSGECKAAKLYLSGTTSSKYDWYCTRVAYWSKNYEDKLN
ncbi:MAG: lytic murein transglycosylase [Candidatus Moranbacteria bacterium]|nr:lytic murein transglycosylase [Candidatus Moranbacteria bacterium]